MAVFYSKQLNFVTIEEPEAHLYPYSQYKLIDLISRVHHCHVCFILSDESISSGTQLFKVINHNNQTRAGKRKYSDHPANS